jgi:hypothetical protein
MNCLGFYLFSLWERVLSQGEGLFVQAGDTLALTLSQREGGPLNCAPSADAVAGNGRPLNCAPSADAVAGNGRPLNCAPSADAVAGRGNSG